MLQISNCVFPVNSEDIDDCYGSNGLKNCFSIKNKKPVKFIETFIFQFLNPKGVIASIIVVSTYIDPGENFVNYTTQIIILALLVSVTSITLWTFMGKFIRKFATNQKFINYFNYAMSLLLLLSIISFYL